MLAFALNVFLLLPLGTLQLQNSKPLRNTETNQWTVKNGHILDPKGREVGIFGLDSSRPTLVR